MTAFRALLVLFLLVLIAYTAVVIAEHGWNLFPAFLGDLTALGWPGQFNLDFSMMLALSALWTAWRNGFSPAGLGLGLLAFFGGALFLCAYLLVLSGTEGGDARRMVLGVRAQKVPE